MNEEQAKYSVDRYERRRSGEQWGEGERRISHGEYCWAKGYLEGVEEAKRILDELGKENGRAIGEKNNNDGCSR